MIHIKFSNLNPFLNWSTLPKSTASHFIINFVAVKFDHFTMSTVSNLNLKPCSLLPSLIFPPSITHFLISFCLNSTPCSKALTKTLLATICNKHHGHMSFRIETAISVYVITYFLLGLAT